MSKLMILKHLVQNLINSSLEKYLTYQAIQQHKIWYLVNPNAVTPTAVENLLNN